MNNTKKLCAAFAVLMTAATLWLLTSCGANPMKNVSERRSGYYTAADSAFTVTAVSGVRENDYRIDGVCGTLKEYTLVTVVPAEFDVDAVYSYTAKTAAGEYGGALIAHPFASSFSAEFDSETTGEFTLCITAGDVTREYTMSSLVTAEMMSYAAAIDAARHELDPQGGCEIRARLIKNPLGGDGLCWHVAFSDGEHGCGVLLDPITAKVLAKKTD